MLAKAIALTILIRVIKSFNFDNIEAVKKLND